MTSLVGAKIAGIDELRSTCPYCSGEISVSDVVFAGLPILGDARCSGCGHQFWLHWPTGHALLHPTLVDAANARVFHDGNDWYPRLVGEIVASRDRPKRPEIKVHERVPRTRAALVVNCVDTVYGHSILKLLGALPALRNEPAPDLVVVVPSRLMWLVPPSVVQTIEVDLAPRSSDVWLAGLHETLMDVLARYERVEIASGISQPELTRDDTALLRAELTQRPDWPPPSGLQGVTFVLRDDRRWVGSETILLRGLRRLLPRPFLETLERRRQNRQVHLVSAGIRRSSPTVDISIVGVGEPGGMPGWVSDLRTPRPTAEDELRWCQTLADSRTAVGVHGSHMLLPSLLSSAVVDLVPWFKLPNIGQDLVIADEASREPKTCLFRYRMIHANIGHKPLAEMIVSTLRDADYQYWTIVGNRETVGATSWPRPPGRWRELE